MNNRGLTLVEVAVAAVLVLLISLALLRTGLASRYSMRGARVHLEAANVLQSFMEQQKSQNYVNIQDASFANVLISDAGTVDPADDILGTITIDVMDNGDDTKTILGTVTWMERFLNQSVVKNFNLQTLVSEP